MLTPALVDPSAVPSLASIEEEIRAGMPGEQERWACAWENEQFYQLKNAQFVEKREAEDDLGFQERPKRTSKLTRAVIRKLADLYKTGPTREIPGNPRVDGWIQGVYADTHVNSVMQEAERASTLNGVAAVQIDATGDPDRPVRYTLWKASELAVFHAEGDPSKVWAVVVKDQIASGPGKKRMRYRAYTAAERVTYVTDEYDLGTTAGARRADTFVPEQSGPSPYPGVLPFVFVRNEPAVEGFWDGGIGTALKECNREVDRAYCDVAEHVLTFLNPQGFVRNVSLQTRFLKRAGHFLHLKSTAAAREGDSAAQPEAFYLQPSLAVEQAWLDIKNYADATLEELEVPLTTIHSDASTDLSGVAVVAKALPLQERTRGRQPQFAEYETDLAARTSPSVSSTRPT